MPQSQTIAPKRPPAAPASAIPLAQTPPPPPPASIPSAHGSGWAL